jgi:hypothetical protein
MCLSGSLAEIESVASLAISRSTYDLTVTVHLNGKAKCNAIVERADSDGIVAIVAVDQINPVLQKERKAFSELVPDLRDRDKVESLLLEIADEVSTVRAKELKSKPTKEEPSPFKPVEPWEDPVDGAELLDDVGALIARYMVLSSQAIGAIALWTAHTYLVDVADYTPYLHVSSPTRECGKSTLLDLLQRLAFRGMLTSGITAAALYRRIDRHGPTMLVDEIDTRIKGENAEIYRGVLNSGFHREGRFTICVGEAHDEKDFKTFGPKVLAGIGRIPDTVTSRSIPIRLARASKEELKLRQKIQGHTIDGICEPYRRRLQRWADDHREGLRETDPQVPTELGARQADVWRPLLAIADAIGADWPLLARESALTLHGTAEEESDYGLLILGDIRDLVEAQPAGSGIFSGTIVAELAKLEHRPWPEYRHDRPITTRGVASLLGRFGIKPTAIRNGLEVEKGYRIEALAPAFKRYLPPHTAGVTNVTQPLGGIRQAGWEPEQSTLPLPEDSL